jgi:hypothetical protein
MNTIHQYILEKGSSKFNCPQCNKKTFVLYINSVTGEYLSEQYGRCDRESKCSYHLNPYLDGYVKAIQEKQRDNSSVFQNKWKSQLKIAKPQPTIETVYFDFGTFKQTLQPERYEKNTFIQNLFYNVQFPFEVEDITKVIQLFRLGTVSNGYRAGAITFPFIDFNNNVRAVQVKQFNEQNHTTGTDFLHSIIEKYHTLNDKPLPEWLTAYVKQDKRISCLFGEHLLSKYHSNPVALVEAPKTAVYGTLYFGLPETPESIIWLAVYNKSSFSFDKLKVLKGRFVYVFPDLSKEGNTFKEWENKAKEYESRLPGTRFIFSDLLEKLAPERDKSEGNDIADYLIKQDWQLYRKRKIQENSRPAKLENSEVSEHSEAPKTNIFSNNELLLKVDRIKTKRIAQLLKVQPQNWSNDILELENFFKSIEIPNHPIKLNKCSTITNCFLFIDKHIATVNGNNGNKTFLPYLNRLKELKKVLTIN